MDRYELGAIRELLRDALGDGSPDRRLVEDARDRLTRLIASEDARGQHLDLLLLVAADPVRRTQ